VSSSCVAYRDVDGVKRFAQALDDDRVPVSFGERTASGRVKIRLADLVKVGPEGYIHGYICVRPPCGQYKEAVHSRSNGKILDGDGNRIGQQLKKEPGDAGYRIRYIVPGSTRDYVNISPQFATRDDAAKAVVIYHNIRVLRDSAYEWPDKRQILSAASSFQQGDYAAAEAKLEEVAQAEPRDARLSTHAHDLALAIHDAPKPVDSNAVKPATPVTPAASGTLMSNEAGKKAIQELKMSPSASTGSIGSYLAYAEDAVSDGDRDSAVTHLATAGGIAYRSGDIRFSGRVDDLIRQLKGEPPTRADFKSRLDTLYNNASYTRAEERIGAALAAVNNGDYAGAADRLDEAAMLSFGVDDLKTKEAAQKLAAQIRATPKPAVAAKFDFAPHIATFGKILADPRVSDDLNGLHVRNDLTNAIDSMNIGYGGGLKGMYGALNFAESDARHAHLDDIADQIRAATDKLKDEQDAFNAAKVTAMAPGWQKDLLSDPKYMVPKNGFQVVAKDRNDVPLSLHPTAEKEMVPQYFTSEKAVDDFIRDNSSAYRYDPYWKAHGRSKPTVKAKAASFSIRRVENGSVEGGMPLETRQPGEVTEYGGFGDGPSDVTASQPIRFAPYAKNKYVDMVNPNLSANKRAELAAEVRRQYKHQDSLIPSVVRNTTTTVTDAPQRGPNSATLADYQASADIPFHGDTRLTPDIFTAMKYGEAASVLRDGQRSGWWVPTDSRWSLADNVIAHEIGHGVAAKAFKGSVPQDDYFWRQFAEATGALYANMPYSDKMNSYRKDGINEWVKANAPALKKSISKYGTTNAAEMMAELWAEYSLSSSPRLPAKLYGDYVSRIIKQQEEGG
jgi:hypothetical protein